MANRVNSFKPSPLARQDLRDVPRAQLPRTKESRATRAMDSFDPIGKNPAPGTRSGAGVRVNITQFRSPENDDAHGGRDLERILKSLNKRIDGSVPVAVGSYNYNQATADKIRELRPTALYAPAFNVRGDNAVKRLSVGPISEHSYQDPLAGQMPWMLTHYWQRDPNNPHKVLKDEKYPYRPLTTTDPDQAATFASGKLRNAQDPVTHLASKDMTPAEIRAWGMEMGQRIRDRLRGKDADAWQLDEIVPTTSKNDPRGETLREFYAAVLEGARTGRPQFGDKEMKGIVQVANPGALFGARKKLDPDQRKSFDKLMRELDLSTMTVVGEDYPAFTGNATVKADHQVGPVITDLHGMGPVGNNLLGKYIVGLSPGEIGGTLHGKVHGMPEKAADKWRQEYMEEAMKLGAHGIGEYNFTPGKGRTTGGNSDPKLISDLALEIGNALKIKG